MSLGSRLAGLSVRRHKTVTATMVGVTLLIALLAALPSVFPGAPDFLHEVRVDTDPENMLDEDEPVRVFHRRMKKEFDLYDMVVVGIINDEDPNGVFNPSSLRRIYETTEFAKTLAWPEEEDPNTVGGVIRADMIAPSMVDKIIPGTGTVRFEWLMPEPPETQAGAVEIREQAGRIHMFEGTLVSDDGKALALYLPISEKEYSYPIYTALRQQREMLWLWADVVGKLQELEDVPDEEMRSFKRIGRMIAQNAADRAEFDEMLELVTNRITDGKIVPGLKQVRDGLSAWEETAGTLDAGAEGKSPEARYRVYRRGHERLVGHLGELARDQELSNHTPLAGVIQLWAEGRVETYESTEALRERTVEYVERLIETWSEPGNEATAKFGKLPQMVSSVLDEAPEDLGPEQFHITGLPVAEDVFGVQMFMQMAISAPAAMLVIFLLMLAFFRKLVLILSPLIVAMVSVIFTMGALVIAGFPIHIMSSMIPIFIMPIAVLDSVHIISEFFDLYQQTKDRRETVKRVMSELFTPMLYTSLTSAAGFASLALTPIPPVQVFGIFVAIGVMVAWAVTITFIPAYIMFIPEKALANFGAKHVAGGDSAGHRTILGRVLRWLSGATYRRAKPIVAVAVVVLVIAGWGISLIDVNDNPIKWFDEGHDIRIADAALNDHFAGTYMAYLAFEAEDMDFAPGAEADRLAEAAEARAGELADSFEKAPEAFGQLGEMARQVAAETAEREAFYRRLSERAGEELAAAEAEESWPQADAWAEAQTFVEQQAQRFEVFKDPAVLSWLTGFQAYLRDHSDVVGKTNSLADIVKTVYRDLLSGEPKDYRIPENRRQVAQTLIQYQNSHRPQDLWHFVTPDYRASSMWFQLASGDNNDMERVVRLVDGYIDENPLPAGIARPQWFGLTYINVVWQQKMVVGMLNAFAGSFLVVFLLMTILFRSALWGLLSMIPLTVTITAIYGAVGIVGKDYDMPVAVLSSLTLGLAVDFAIHFLARSRAIQAEEGTWERSLPRVFDEPARAISRNIIVIAAGFIPLVMAPLVPYQTVGMLMATILLVSGIATLILLPALVKLLRNRLFRDREAMGPTCNCVACLLTGAAAVALLGVTVYPYLPMHWSTLTWIGAGLVPLAALGCGVMSRRRKCRLQELSGREHEEQQQTD